MSAIKGKTLFFVTSPRTPLKIVPEIELLSDKFEGRTWNEDTQSEYMHELVKMDFYQGSTNLKNPALSARDRITRAPKAYGFVDLKPTISLTNAGKAFVDAKYKEEVFLRQLVKFQLPSPFHKISSKNSTRFWVKPYLELLRLIRYFGSLSFDEIMLFGMQLTDYRLFDSVVGKIEDFRIAKDNNKGKYRDLLNSYCEKEIRSIYSDEFTRGDFHTRESKTETPSDFIKKKRRTLRDNADACYRYLRATGVVTTSRSGHSLSVASEKAEEVDFLLEKLDRDPIYVDDETNYKKYLFDASEPKLLSDDFDNLTEAIHKIDPENNCEEHSIVELKGIWHELLDQKKQNLIDEQVKRIKSYEDYDEIVEVFGEIKSRDAFYDKPLMFEWNTWRAMTMIDGGRIRANLKFDDTGMPLSTAAGNKADVVCDYESFILNVEVTLTSGQRQYEKEGEPVARHVGKTKKATRKPTYCFFIAPKINDATKAYFYMLTKHEVNFYGGRALIIPLELATFERMLANSKEASCVPGPQRILDFVNQVQSLAEEASDENDWFDRTKEAALNWLGVS